MPDQQFQEHLRDAHAAHAAGRLGEAERHYARLVELVPGNADLWHLLGVVAYQRGDSAKAIEAFARALALRFDFPQAHNNLALALKAGGRTDEAADEFAAALALRPEYPEAAYNLGLLRESSGDVAGAEKAYRLALNVRSDWPEALGNLGNLLRRSDRAAEAQPLLERAMQLRPDDASAIGNLALLRLDQGRFAEARTLAERAHAAAPDVAMWWETAGSAARLSQDPDAAMALLERALALDPGNAGTWFELGLAQEASGDHERALETLAKARALAPRWERLRWAEALLLPALVDDDAMASRALERFDRGLESLEAGLALDSPAARDAALEAAASTLPFNLHYIPGDHTHRQRRFADLCARAVRAALPEFAKPPAPRASRERVRVGFVSAYLRRHVVARFFGAFITGLPAKAFERWVWAASPEADDWTAAIAASVEHFEQRDASVPELASRIRGADLDVLVYPDIGLDPAQHALAALRLAPVQIALYGHPVTSGLDSVDYFVSGELLEPPGADALYSEKLVRLPGLGCSPRAPEGAGDGGWARRLRQGSMPLLVCAQSFPKIPPSFDAVLARIVAENRARLVVFDRGPSLTRRFAARLRRAFRDRGVDEAALHVEPVRAYADFVAGLAEADLVLDTPGFSGGATSLDALGAGAPVLCLSGDSARARQTSAMAKRIGVEELIAADDADYARRARELIADTAARQSLRAAILERNHLLFDDPEPLAAFARLLRG